MNGPSWIPEASTVIALLATALAGLSLYYVRTHVLDKLEKLDAEAVRKRELKELEERLTQDQQEMHAQNRELLSDIRSDIREMGKRIDNAFNRGGGR